MEFRRNVVEPFDGFVAGEAAGRGQELTVWNGVRQVLHDGDAFSQERTVIQQQRGNLTFWVYREKIIAVFQTFLH